MDSELRQTFIESMSRVASAVAVVTTDGDAGRFGVTVSSMTSVSADTPRPSLLVSVHHMNPACEAIRKNRSFCANILSSSQSFVSDLFSGRVKKVEDRFAAVSWRPGVTGAPMLEGAVVSLDCELKTALLWGTHFLFIGEVEEIALSSQRSPLVYANRGYRRAVPLSSDDELHAAPPENQLRVGFFITLGPELVPALVADLAEKSPDAQIRLLEADHDDLLEQMRARRIEAAISFGAAPDPETDAEIDPEIDIEIIRKPDPHVLLSADHPLAGRPGVRLADLGDLPMILLDYPSVRRAVDALFRRAEMKPRIRLQSPSFAMVRGLVARNLGYSLVPQPPRNRSEMDGKAVVAVPLEENFPEGAVIALTRKGEGRSDLALEFVARCKAAFAAESG